MIYFIPLFVKRSESDLNLIKRISSSKHNHSHFKIANQIDQNSPRFLGCVNNNFSVTNSVTSCAT